MEIRRVGSERPPYWNIRLREANSSSGRERKTETGEMVVSQPENSSPILCNSTGFQEFFLLSIEIKKEYNTIVFKLRNLN